MWGEIVVNKNFLPWPWGTEKNSESSKKLESSCMADLYLENHLGLDA